MRLQANSGELYSNLKLSPHSTFILNKTTPRAGVRLQASSGGLYSNRKLSPHSTFILNKTTPRAGVRLQANSGELYSNLKLSPHSNVGKRSSFLKAAGSALRYVPEKSARLYATNSF